MPVQQAVTNMKKKLSKEEKKECDEMAKKLQKELPQYSIKTGNPGITVRGWYTQDIPYEALKKYPLNVIKREVQRRFDFY